MKRTELIRLIIISMMAVIFAIGMTACGNKSAEQDQTETEAVTEAEEAAGDADSEQAGETAPDFEAELADGTTMTLSEAEGKVVLLNFWATWCGPCVEEMPAIQKLYDDYNATKVQILAVDCAETRGEVDTFIREQGYTFPIVYDEDGSIGSLYPTTGIPYTVIIDANGKVVQTFLGSDGADAQYEKYKAAIDKALGE